MIVEQLHIVPAGSERDAYLSPLCLADDSVAQVQGYCQSGDLDVSDAAAIGPVAIVLAIAEPEGAVQLKSVAVATRLHGRGIGTRLVAAVLDDLRPARRAAGDRGHQRLRDRAARVLSQKRSPTLGRWSVPTSTRNHPGSVPARRSPAALHDGRHASWARV